MIPELISHMWGSVPQYKNDYSFVSLTNYFNRLNYTANRCKSLIEIVSIKIDFKTTTLCRHNYLLKSAHI